MKHGEHILACQRIIDFIKYSYTGRTKQEIINEIRYNFRQADGKISERTIDRCIEEIRNHMQVNLIFDRSSKTYRITDNKRKIESIESWISSSYALSSNLSEHKSLSKRILIEPIPSARFLNHILLEMEKSSPLWISYRDYNANDVKSIKIEPYCVKTYHNRWYVLGKKCDNGKFSIYCLDRVEGITLCDEYFTIDPDFDAEKYFMDYYAVRIEEDMKPESIILRAYGNERYIMEKQPFHHSQKKLKEYQEYTDFKIKMKPTYDFVSFLESLGRYIEVMEPLSLRKELVRVHSDAIERNILNSD